MKIVNAVGIRAYLLVLLLFVIPPFLSAAELTDSKMRASSTDNYREVYARAVELERDASLKTVCLDQLGQKKKVVKTVSCNSSVTQKQLLEVDLKLNRAIEELYASAWKHEKGPGSTASLQVALFHWTVLVRRASMAGFHTKVPGLVNDPDCKGDFVAQRMLMRYFDAVEVQRETDAALALADIARQTACIGVMQSHQLAVALANSFDELRAFLRLNGREDLVPYVVQAASNPMLLIYDVEKYRMATSPLTQWFRDHRDILSEGAEFGRSPARWHALWLYDRRSGRLAGYRVTLKPMDENDVDLSLFYQSIVQAENLGDYGCSFSEMIERGAGAFGYVCGAASCRDDTRPPSTGSNGRPLRLADRSADPTVRGLRSLDKIFAQAVCSAGGDGRDTGGGVPKCGAEDRFGGNRTNAAVRCLSEQIVRPGTEGFHCLAEPGGRCASPGGKLIKDLQATSFAGIKVPPGCKLSVGMGDVKAYEEQVRQAAEARQKEMDRLRDLIDTLNGAIAEDKALQDSYNDQAARDYQDYLEAKGAAEATGHNPATDPLVADAERKARDSAEKARLASQATTDTILHAEMLKAQAEQDLKKKEKEDAAKKKEEDKKTEEEKKKEEAGKGGKRCAPDNPNCGDSCNAMSQAAMNTLGCIQASISGTHRDPLGSAGGCDPKNCDPIEPNAGASGNRACFDSITNDPAVATSKVCWAFRCAQGQTPVAGQNGCSCNATGGLQPTQIGMAADFCAQAHCAEGSNPIYQNGRCACAGDGTGGGFSGLPLPKTATPVLGPPPGFTEVRFGPKP